MKKPLTINFEMQIAPLENGNFLISSEQMLSAFPVKPDDLNQQAVALFQEFFSMIEAEHIDQ